MTEPIGDGTYVSIPVSEFEELCERAGRAEESESFEDENPVMMWGIIAAIIVTFLVVILSIAFGYFLGITRNRNE